MKKYLAIVLACLMLVSVFAGCGEKAPTANTPGSTGNKVIKIGVFQPASGDNAAGGKQETLGIEYANEIQPTVEIAGETYDVELVIVDNGSDNAKAPTAASSLISSGVSVVLGSYGSGVSIAASDTFANAGMPVLGITCTNPQVTEGNDHYFRICFLDPFQGIVLANYAYNELGVTKAYCLSKLGDDYSGGLVEYFKQAFIALGGEVLDETFPDGNADFTSYVANAKKADCGVFFSPVSQEAAQLIIQQFDSQGYDKPLLAGDTWDSNVVLQAAKGTNVNLTVTTFYPEGADAAFDSGFKTWVKAQTTRLANNNGDDTVAAVTVMGYDAYFFALEAIKNAGSTEPAAIMDALWGTTYTGVSGPIALDQVNGDAIRNTAYVKVVNTETGTWEALPAVTIE